MKSRFFAGQRLFKLKTVNSDRREEVGRMIHALVATLAFGETRHGMLKRRCPRCGHEQITPEEKLLESVPCGRCAVAIPPKHVSEQAGKRDDERLTATPGGK